MPSTAGQKFTCPVAATRPVPGGSAHVSATVAVAGMPASTLNRVSPEQVVAPSLATPETVSWYRPAASPVTVTETFALGPMATVPLATGTVLMPGNRMTV